MGRSDVAYSVRNAALHVWKTLVTNTPKTLAELLPELMSQTITSLADPGAVPTSIRHPHTPPPPPPSPSPALEREARVSSCAAEWSV